MRRSLLFVLLAFAFILPFAYLAFWVISQGFDFADDYWFGAMGNLLATIIGVAVAIPGGLLLDRLLQSSRQESAQRRIIHQLREELDDALDHELLRDPLSPQIPTVYIDTGSWEAATSGGDLGTFRDLELLAQVSNAYHRIRTLNEWLSRFYDASYGAGAAITVSEGGGTARLSHHVSRVLLNLASEHRPYIEMTASRLRQLDAG